MNETMTNAQRQSTIELYWQRILQQSGQGAPQQLDDPPQAEVAQQVDQATTRARLSLKLNS